MTNNEVRYTITAQDLISNKLSGINSTASKLQSTLGGLTGTLTAVFSGLAVASLGKEIIDTVSEFEKFDAVLTNTLGSGSEAQKALSDITDFASKTPFEVNELTDSFVRLANQGFVPSMKELENLGDLASSKAKSIAQLSEALIDAQVGEFERLKEFGVRAKKDGDNVTFTFKGQTTVVRNTEKAIRDYIVGLGDLNGVSGTMGAISATTGGQISNLKDSFTQLLLVIGQELKPVISSVIGLLSGLAQSTVAVIRYVSQNRQVFLGIIQVIGILTGAYIAFNVWQQITLLWAQREATWMILKAVLGMNVASVTGLMTTAQLALNAAFAANPIGLIIIAIGALVAIVMTCWEKFAGFRAFLFASWEVIKAIVGIMIDHFVALKDVIVGVFTLDVDQVAKGIGDGAKNVMNAGTRLADAAKKGWNEGMKDFAKDHPVAKTLKEDDKKKTKGLASAAATAGNVVKSGAKKETSGVSGTKAVTINVKIGNLIGSYQTNVKNMTESAEQARKIVTKALTDSTNDFQLITGN